MIRYLSTINQGNTRYTEKEKRKKGKKGKKKERKAYQIISHNHFFIPLPSPYLNAKILKPTNMSKDKVSTHAHKQ
jgi:hypothetical protein